MKSIALITYNYPHLKTEQVLLNLLTTYATRQFSIYALPFVPRKERNTLVAHRPAMTAGVAPYLLAETFGIPYTNVAHDYEIPDGADYYLILGAGILSAQFVKNKKTINCHPGVIPAVRGLDAFKWSIYERKPLGVSLHFIDESVDAGEIISIVPTPVFASDTFETLARRHYENEIWVNSHFEHYLYHPTNIFAGIPTGDAHRRMDIIKESEMLERFGDYKESMLSMRS